ncbi:2-C-methyl-D-erythritol 4-phosphate cytidylyltransferase [Amycolatopsis regifaucium]|uniref:2-C-methyl-D-erythritol 4-phosphate cytidylyltransferase n=2 Tax=Amycolatopsis regifaucium TaxID=546365 RepID=A0A154MGX5_9PSEU|nr:2-C-methyl-D-erythritol 4-phosphate cytidylyltransferase [Amycolatopsis regifaucium]OKA08865.1 2-C-methyl-D-erythritol 4-phosphate cytidylyltransferase [Amycolatopsis regifaucium]SFI91412.1 2-C-methyl-D-erythritol 4-phosphate cytidylyltransferase [Amycolatopsis regifaucium]
MSTIVFVTAVHHHASDAELALAPVNGEALLTHTVRGLLALPDLDLVVVAAPERCAQLFSAALIDFPERCRIVPGSSLRHVFDSVENDIAGDPVFLVHDALRAFTPADTVRAVADAVRAGSPSVVPVLPMADTVKVTDATKVITGTEDRAHLRTAQTPLGFTRETFLSYVDKPSLDGAHTIAGHPDAMRVTNSFELKLAEAIASAGKEEVL